VNTFVGLAAMGISSSVNQELIKLDTGTAAMSLFAIFNDLGRIFFVDAVLNTILASEI
jgi:hypothetical protein